MRIYMVIISQMWSGLNSPKDTDVLSGRMKTRTHICVNDYKRPPSHLGTHIESEGIKTGMLCECESKKAGVAYS